MRSVMVSTAAVLAALAGTVGASLTANAAPAESAAAAAVTSYNWLNSVSCSSAKDCVAVGAEYSSTVGALPLAEQWNGKAWKTLAVKLPAGGVAGQLYGVSCKSGECVAAGQFNAKGQPALGFAATWNGTSWSTVKTAVPHGAIAVSLLAISCATAGHCVATGSYELADDHMAPLAETLNGKSWTAATPPVPAGFTLSVLAGVSCTSSASCMAVGQSSKLPVGATAGVVLTDYWNGKAWKRIAAPAPGKTPTLSGVSCTSASRCVAVGNSPSSGAAVSTDTTFADTWNGTKWAEAKVAAPTNRASLTGVACASAAKCLAVGDTFSSATVANDKAYAAAMNGTHWSVTKTPATPSADDSEFRAVTCSSATACIAVGLESLETAEAPYSAAALWNGSTWTTANPAR
jgi:hypothetical protein